MIDSHAHLNDEKIINDIDSIITRAKEVNCTNIMVPGWDIISSKAAIDLSKRFDEIIAAVGIHPENIDGLSIDDIKIIKEISKFDKVKAIGEIGLDYYWRKDNKDIQKKFFEKQIELSYELNLPIIIHSRDSIQDVYDILYSLYKRFGKRENPGVLHSYSGSKEMMMSFLNLGYYISFSGPVTYKNASSIKECALHCPLDRILVETDSPYLPPVPLRGTINEPKNTLYILEEISRIKGISIEELEKHTVSNFKRLFLGE